MQETLSKLQIEKQNRAQAIHKALSRQNNNTTVNTGFTTHSGTGRNNQSSTKNRAGRGNSIDFTNTNMGNYNMPFQNGMRRSRCDSVISTGSRKSAAGRSRTSTSESRGRYSISNN